MRRSLTILLTALLLGIPALAGAQGVGIFQTAPGGNRQTCNDITGPIVGRTFCLDHTTNKLKVWTGTAWIPVTIESFTLAGLPAAGNIARLAMLTDALPSIRFDDGTAWRTLFDNISPIVTSHTGPYAFGGPALLNNQVRIQGTYTSPGLNLSVLVLGATLTPDPNMDAYGFRTANSLTKAASGTHGLFTQLYVNPVSNIGGAAAVNDAPSLFIAGQAVGVASSVLHNYALWVQAPGTFQFDDPGPHAIGGLKSTIAQLRLTGTYTGGATDTPRTIDIDATLAQGGAGNDAYAMALRPTLNKFSSGTHGLFVTLFAQAPIIGGGAAALNSAATIYITGAPVGATTNYALWINAGDVRWGAPLVALGGGVAPTLGTIGGAGPTTAAQNSWMRVIDSTGAAFWIPAWK